MLLYYNQNHVYVNILTFKGKGGSNNKKETIFLSGGGRSYAQNDPVIVI